MFIIYLISVFTVSKACNPLHDKNCFVQNQALGEDLVGFEFKYFKTQGDVQANHGVSQEIIMKLNERFQNPMIESNFYILYGKVECEILASSGQGIISSFYLQSNDLDEIDIAELFGGNPYEFQSNFFIKGNTTTWDRGGYHQIRNPLQYFNKYTVEWTPTEIKWWCNDILVRTLENSNTYGIPRSPMAVKLSLWAGGDESNQPGTILWAGGKCDYKEMPYMMKVRNLRVSDYSSGTVYSYGYEEGQWKELESDGLIGGRNPQVREDSLKDNDDNLHRDINRQKSQTNKPRGQIECTENESSNNLYQLSIYFCIEVFIILCWL